MDKFIELVKDLTSGFRDRLKNPFTVALIISWVVWNWQPLLFIIKGEPELMVRIDYVRKLYSDPWLNVVFPLLSAVIYLLIIPHLLLLVEKWGAGSLNERKRLNIESETKEYKAKASLIRAQVELEFIKNEQQGQADLQVKIEELKKENNDLKTEVGELTAQQYDDYEDFQEAKFHSSIGKAALEYFKFDLNREHSLEYPSFDLIVKKIEFLNKQNLKEEFRGVAGMLASYPEEFVKSDYRSYDIFLDEKLIDEYADGMKRISLLSLLGKLVNHIIQDMYPEDHSEEPSEEVPAAV